MPCAAKSEVWKCNCPDHETRGTKCKHAWAVEISMTRIEQNADGTTTVSTVKVTAERKTYARPGLVRVSRSSSQRASALPRLAGRPLRQHPDARREGSKQRRPSVDPAPRCHLQRRDEGLQPHFGPAVLRRTSGSARSRLHLPVPAL